MSDILKTLEVSEFATMAKAVIQDRGEQIERLTRELESSRDANMDAMSTIASGMLALDEARRERDEARALLQRWSDIYTDADTSSEDYCTGRLNLGMETMRYLAGDRQGDSRSATGSTPAHGTRSWNV